MRLKVNARVDVLPIVDCVPVDTPATFSGSLHSRAGTSMRNSSTTAVQITACWSPAVSIFAGEIVTEGARRAKKQQIKCSKKV